MTEIEILERLDRLGLRWRRRPSGVIAAHCPLGPKRRGRYDLTITETDTGRLLLHCHGQHGCDFDAIREALGLARGSVSPFSVKASRSSRRSGGRKPVTLDCLTVISMDAASALAAFEAAGVEPVPVTLRLPWRAGRLQRLVAAELELIFGMRLALGEHGPTTYLVNRAASRLGEDRSNVAAALRSLVQRHQALRNAGKLRPRGFTGIASEVPASERKRWARLYRLPSELMAGIDLPARERAQEAAARVAAVGRVEPLAEPLNVAAVPGAELEHAMVGEVAQRWLAAVRDRAGLPVEIVGGTLRHTVDSLAGSGVEGAPETIERIEHTPESKAGA